MSFDYTKAKQQIAAAFQGDNRAASQALKQLADALQSLDDTELGFINGVTAGTMTASKALVVDSNGQIDKLKSKNESAVSSSTKLAIYGTTRLDSTGQNFLLPVLEAGQEKRIWLGGGTSTNTTVTTEFTSTNKIYIHGGTLKTCLTFKLLGSGVVLEGIDGVTMRLCTFEGLTSNIATS